MSSLLKNNLKLYIQDLYRANRDAGNKYNYEVFGIHFKNVLIHGIVTAAYNRSESSVYLEVTDPTASIAVYYDSKRSDTNVPDLKDLVRSFASRSRAGDVNISVMSSLLDGIVKKREQRVDFHEGDYVSVLGLIVVDQEKDVRMVSAFECVKTSIERDIVWLEEMRYLYEKFYLWKKGSPVNEA